jgi:hypothetical protein
MNAVAVAINSLWVCVSFVGLFAVGVMRTTLDFLILDKRSLLLRFDSFILLVALDEPLESSHRLKVPVLLLALQSTDRQSIGRGNQRTRGQEKNAPNERAHHTSRTSLESIMRLPSRQERV